MPFSLVNSNPSWVISAQQVLARTPALISASWLMPGNDLFTSGWVFESARLDGYEAWAAGRNWQLEQALALSLKQCIDVTSMTTPRILYCHCQYAQVVPPEVKAAVLRKLCESGVAFDAVVGATSTPGARTVYLKANNNDITAFAGGLEVQP